MRHEGPSARHKRVDQGVSEEELVERARQGDENAFTRLYRKHENYLRAFLQTKLRKAEDVDEVANDAFRKAHKNLGRFETRSSFRTWLTRIASNAAIDRLRQHKRVEDREIQVENRSGQEDGPATSVESFPDPSGDPMTAMLEKGKKMQIERALAGLSDVLQQTYRLRYESDLSYKEIAKAMDCKIGTVMSRISTLKEKLGAYIQEEDKDNDALAA